MHIEDLEIMVLTREDYRRLWQVVEEMQNLLWKVKRITEVLGTEEE